MNKQFLFGVPLFLASLVQHLPAADWLSTEAEQFQTVEAERRNFGGVVGVVLPKKDSVIRTSVELPQRVEAQIWARVYFPWGGQDAMSLTLDDRTFTLSAKTAENGGRWDIGNFQVWHWVCAGTAKLQSGRHALAISPAKGVGQRVDRVVLYWGQAPAWTQPWLADGTEPTGPVTDWERGTSLVLAAAQFNEAAQVETLGDRKVAVLCNDGDRLRTVFRTKRSLRARLWARVYFEAKNMFEGLTMQELANNFYLSLDGQLVRTVFEQNGRQWHWVAADEPCDLNPGLHLITLAKQGLPVKIDQVVLYSGADATQEAWFRAPPPSSLPWGVAAAPEVARAGNWRAHAVARLPGMTFVAEPRAGTTPYTAERPFAATSRQFVFELGKTGPQPKQATARSKIDAELQQDPGQQCEGQQASSYEHPWPSAFGSITVVGDTAYVADYNYGLWLFDLSDPRRPKRLRGVATAGESDAIWLDGDRAYQWQTFGGAVFLLDLANPGAPQRLGEYWDGCWLPYGNSRRGNNTHAGKGGFLYVPRQDRGLLVVDVRNPARPQQVAEFRDEKDQPVVRVHGACIDVWGDRACVICDRHLLVYDVSRAGQPRLLSTLAIPPADLLAAKGDRVYLGHAKGGFAVVDVADPAKPAVLSQLDLLPLCPVKMGEVISGLTVAKGHAFLTGRTPRNQGANYLHVVDVRDPRQPRWVKTYQPKPDLPDAPCSLWANFYQDLVADGDYLFIGDYGEIQCLDIAEPAAPRLVDALPVVRRPQAGAAPVCARLERLGGAPRAQQQPVAVGES